jgi:hypothetical protein
MFSVDDADRFPRVPFSAKTFFADSQNKELSNWNRCHRPAGSATERDELEDLPCSRTVGTAIHFAPGFRGKADNKLQIQALSGAASLGSQSKRHPYFFKKLLPLRLRKPNDQPSKARR